MTNRRIIWEKPDDTIAVTIPAPNGRKPNESEDVWVERVALRAQETVLDLNDSLRLPDDLAENLPDRYFRNCWRKNGLQKVNVDLPLARIQRTNEIRKERDARFMPLDAEYNKFQGQNDTTGMAIVESKRQLLRDIPANTDLESITDPLALQHLIPNWPE